jgi:hypothetical protein
MWAGSVLGDKLGAQQLLMLCMSVTLRTTYSNKSTVIKPRLDRVRFNTIRDLLHSKPSQLLGHLLLGSPADSCCSVGIQGP